jgi:hypothetical protein
VKWLNMNICQVRWIGTDLRNAGGRDNCAPGSAICPIQSWSRQQL